MTQDMAETRALGILGWVLSRDDLLPVFLGATGATEDALRDSAGDPVFLASVVDFLMLDDAWVIDCAAVLGWPPTEIMAIRAGLPGGDLPNWT
jgi:hypothetical protein